jgi:hypothetical protein
MLGGLMLDLQGFDDLQAVIEDALPVSQKAS